jgi:hypothetical protein
MMVFGVGIQIYLVSFESGDFLGSEKCELLTHEVEERDE